LFNQEGWAQPTSGQSKEIQTKEDEKLRSSVFKNRKKDDGVGIKALLACPMCVKTIHSMHIQVAWKLIWSPAT
jgi:hypothetical protein